MTRIAPVVLILVLMFTPVAAQPDQPRVAPCRPADSIVPLSGLAEASGLYAIRRDIKGAHSAAALEQRLGRALRPITLGPGLLAHLDHSKHAAILRRWQQAIAAR